MITVVMTNYKRLENVKHTISNLKNQTIKPEIVVLDNSEGDNDLKDICDSYINFGRNVSCSHRWKIAAESNNPYVLIIDDDISPSSDNALEYLVFSINGTDAVGTHGVKITNKDDYYKCEHVVFPRDETFVDIIKGRMFFVRTDLLKDMDATMDEFCEDDIIISSKLKSKRIVSNGSKYFKNLSEMGIGLWKRPDHFQRRTIEMKKSFEI